MLGVLQKKNHFQRRRCKRNNYKIY